MSPTVNVGEEKKKITRFYSSIILAKEYAVARKLALSADANFFFFFF